MEQTRSRRRRPGACSSNLYRGRRPDKGGSSRRFSSSRNKTFSRGQGGNRGKRKQPQFNPTQFINKNPVEHTEEVFVPKHTFASFGLSEEMVATLRDLGILTPTPIQDGAIPSALEGRDVLGIAETGTGKTAAFLLPLIEKALADTNQVTLILAPTRELAIQIEDEFRKFTKKHRLFSVVCVGGMSIRAQIAKLKKYNHFVIGTPGRVKDLINQGYIKPEMMTNVVLDEADRMLDMGFIHDMRDILSRVRKERQTLFFSATMNREAEKLVDDFLRDPVRISVKKKAVTDSIEQDIVPYMPDAKFDILKKLLLGDEYTRVIVFGQMKHAVERLGKDLRSHGIKAESIHGNKSHNQRQRSLKRFKSGEADVLVATDVAARGIHVDDVSHVINYELPSTLEDYVHRIGRTGRGKKRGKALTFVQKTRYGNF